MAWVGDDVAATVLLACVSPAVAAVENGSGRAVAFAVRCAATAEVGVKVDDTTVVATDTAEVAAAVDAEDGAKVARAVTGLNVSGAVGAGVG